MDNGPAPRTNGRGGGDQQAGRGRAGGQRGRGNGRNGERRGGGGQGRGRGGARAAGNQMAGTTENERAANGEDAAQSIPVANSAPPRPAENEDDEDEGEVCFICASPVVHHSVAPCNHRTCHICALRLRALYKSKACAHCRTTAETVIFTDDPEKRFEAFTGDDFAMHDPNLGIEYEKPEIFEDTVLLLRYNCPDSTCDVACLGWPDLHRHVKTVHHRVMCDLCTRNKKVFTHEHELFTVQDLRKHERFGDDHPGAVDQSGFKGHPECGFCKQRFYGDDELYTHCRDRHEKCHVCDRRNNGRQPQYYLDYNALEVHFRKDHYMCPDRECLEKKFVVFDSEMDLKAHQLEAHPNGVTKDSRKVDISGFDYRAPHQEDRPRREGRGRGRGRDPNAEPLPPSSAQPMRRDELAYQRQMAIHSAQSVTSRSFGGALTRPEPTATITPPQPSNNALTLDDLSLDPTPTANLTPQEQAKRMRQAAVTERASLLLQKDASKIAEFRVKVSSYTSGTLPAQGLIESFFTLFDAPSSELGKLVKELSDTFEQPSKRDNLAKAWSDWKAINEDYPSLPGPSAAASSGKGGATKTWASSLAGPNVTVHTAHASGSRVLRLKSSTAQSGRTAASRSLTTGNPFPPLATSIAPTSKSRPQWFNSIPTGATNTASSKILSMPSGASSAATSARPSPALQPQRAPGRDLFPALPAAKKPTSTVFSPGYTGAGVRRVNAPVVGGNPWGGASSNGAATPLESADEVVDMGKKKGKGKKQVLYNWG